MTPYYDPKKNYLENITSIEKAACTMQGQFFYFDPTIYPYGIPQVFNNNDMFAKFEMGKLYNRDKDRSVKHFQIFFNVTKSNYADKLPQNTKYPVLEFMNCFMGPMHLTAPSTFWFNFYTVPGNSYSYEFRVIYLQRERSNSYEEAVPVLSEFSKRDSKWQNYFNVYEKLYDDEKARRRTCLTIEFVYPNDIDSKEKAKNSKQLIDLPGWAKWKTCPYTFPYTDREENAFCNNKQFFKGFLRMYSAGIFNHETEDVNPLISIEPPTQRYKSNYAGADPKAESAGFLIGVEIILRPHMN